MHSIIYLITIFIAFFENAHAFVDIATLLDDDDSRITTSQIRRKRNDDEGGNGFKERCRQISNLSKLIADAENQIILDEIAAESEKGFMKVEEFKMKAAEAVTKLAALEATPAMIEECKFTQPTRNDKRACRAIRRLPRVAGRYR
ncbi:hypothetical protein BU24DRAFT_469206 [Aaosphaeria arxii CBS 175.79]|uniref:Uncharacterized protein n=1 Tax=Aaosphaeria arxii CBS 175.79 TaxID=1450172 RepID=A0A6A5Y4F5_9PLEO|nr:uncharacterized protein BU24DRAFT_469206 [Aaosphaeria arxii CBS 175.79]KAF2020432.1 hypothetical protein BU24DRAFT_469206 [Aaosphaeria arxii CBS 175.79]